MLKPGRKKRAIAKHDELVSKSEDCHGFRGNQPVDSLVEYIEGGPKEHATVPTKGSNKDSEAAKNKNKHNRRKNGLGSKTEKSKKTVPLVEKEVANKNDDELRVKNLPVVVECLKSSDDSEEVLSVDQHFSPKSGDLNSPSSCSLDGTSDPPMIEIVKKDDDAIVFSHFHYETGDKSEKCSRQRLINAEKTCQKMKSDENKSCLVNNSPIAPFVPNFIQLNNPPSSSPKTGKVAASSAQCFPNQIAQPKFLTVDEQCRCCQPSKVHVEFLDSDASTTNAKESDVLNDLSFGCFEDCCFNVHPPSSSVNNNNSWPPTTDINKNVIAQSVVEIFHRTKLSQVEKRNEIVHREVKDFVNKRKNLCFPFCTVVDRIFY